LSDQPFDHTAVFEAASLGNEPSADYLKRVDVLDNVVRECMHVSRGYAGIPSPSSRHFYASVLFTTLISRGLSLAILAPFSPWSSKLIEHWDYASASVIARTMLEIRLCFYYVCVDSCSSVEWECRWNILNLHDCTARIRLFENQPGVSKRLKAFVSRPKSFGIGSDRTVTSNSLPQASKESTSMVRRLTCPLLRASAPKLALS